ncbi:ECF RNA polymerase sigma factor SigK [Streptomyces alboniger]|uniref:Sigma-70 family RNA polymerase sigma factor n=1 Tax=Streptomyces alboniger TaxID=132473 RepID=A0A5J6HY74_STRAD|nr:ECF RNA polymerase sigma factor SigK [Streptomyces alboniger]QEV21967.1 sigma-70 family RNA polymerase sigma factor [Streptomyces alboniger]
MRRTVFIGGNPDDKPDLIALMKQIVDGDEQAFGQLYESVAGPVFGIARAVVRDAAQSEEVTQEVLVEVWRHAADYRPERGSVMNWVLTLAHRRAVDRVRSVVASAAREERAARRAQLPEFDVTEAEVEARQEREDVVRCLKTLTELQRESIILAYYQGLTYREVAERLSASLGTVKTRMRDGLIRLRDCLGVAT